MKKLTVNEFTNIIRETLVTKKLNELFGASDDAQLVAAKKKALQASIDAKSLEVNREKQNLSKTR